MMDHFEFVHKMTKSALDHQAKQQPAQMLADGGDVHALSDPVGGSLPPETMLGGPQTIASGNPGNPNQGLLGGVGNFLGLSNNFQPGATTINPGTNQAQLNQAYSGVQGALGQNQSVANTLAPGVAEGANAENVLAGQFADQAAGRGPNPAQAELNQATGQNIAQTAALLASQRGAGGNAGLLGEQAARMGSNVQQQAVGQGATLQAQQQIAGQQAGANLAATRINQGQNAVQGISQQQQNEQNILESANTAANNAGVTAQGSLNNTNAQIAGSNAAGRGKLLGGLASAGAAAIPIIGPALGGLFAHGGLVKMDRGGNVLSKEDRDKISDEHFALPSRRYPIHDKEHARNALARVSQYGTPSEKARVKAAVMKMYPEIMGQESHERSSSRGTVMVQKKAEGGPIEAPSRSDAQGDASKCQTIRSNTGWGAIVQCDADGGPIVGNPLLSSQEDQPKSFVGQWLNSNVPSNGAQPTISNASELDQAPDISKQLGGLGSAIRDYKGNPKETGLIAGGPDASDLQNPLEMRAAKGGKVPGDAKVGHDSLENDVVPMDVKGGGKAMLSPGELIIDLDTMKDPGPMGKMARALAKHIEAKKKSSKKVGSA